MWLRRLLIRVIVKTAILIGAMWFVLRDVEGPADMLFPVAFQERLKWMLVLLLVCALVLVFWRAIRVILIHLRYRKSSQSFAPYAPTGGAASPSAGPARSARDFQRPE
jgi:hypothetical protein